MKHSRSEGPTDRLISPFAVPTHPEAWDWQPEPARQLASSPFGAQKWGRRKPSQQHISLWGKEVPQGSHIKTGPRYVFWSWQRPPAICSWSPRLGL